MKRRSTRSKPRLISKQRGSKSLRRTLAAPEVSPQPELEILKDKSNNLKVREPNPKMRLRTALNRQRSRLRASRGKLKA